MANDDRILAYAQSGLSKQERDAFEDEMANDIELRAEVRAIIAARAVFAEPDEDTLQNGWARLSEKIDALEREPANDNIPFRLSLLQAACIAVTAVVGWEVVGTALQSNEPASYTTASSALNDPSVQIVFNDMAMVSDVTEILADFQGIIVDGPSALGIYVVAFPDEAARDAAFSALSERTDVISEILVD